MKTPQLILTTLLGLGLFYLTFDGPNLLTPTIGWTVGVLAGVGLVERWTNKIKKSKGI